MREQADKKALGTARFTALVEDAGRPQQVTLWRDPKQDPDFRKAISENRVLTVHQENVGTKKDFGVVGYEPGVLGAYLVFPKRLKEAEGKRVVGIKYDLLAPATAKGKTVQLPLPEKKSEKPRHQQIETEEKEQQFAVTLECTAQLQVTEAISAESKTTAEKLAKERASDRTLDFSNAEKRWRVRSVKKI